MGIIIGVVSATFILSAIYLKIDGNRWNLADKLFIAGLTGMVFFVLIFLMAIFEK
jgi:hypothetical protein